MFYIWISYKFSNPSSKYKVRDFNDLLCQEEKKKGRDSHPNFLMQGFREATMIVTCWTFLWLIILLYKNLGWSWKKKLDHAMATQSWLDNFPNYCPISFISCKSDHSPTVLKLQNNLPFRRPRRFCFENSWLDEDELPHVVTTTLKNSLGNDIVSKLNNCAKELKLWGKNIHSRYRNDIISCKREIEHCRNANDPISTTWYIELEFKLQHLLDHENNIGSNAPRCFGYVMGI